MNDALKNLFTRRSVRKYSPKQIDDAELLEVSGGVLGNMHPADPKFKQVVFVPQIPHL